MSITLDQRIFEVGAYITSGTNFLEVLHVWLVGPDTAQRRIVTALDCKTNQKIDLEEKEMKKQRYIFLRMRQ